MFLANQGNSDHKYVWVDPWDEGQCIGEETASLKSPLPLGAVYLMDDIKSIEQESTVCRAQITQLEELADAQTKGQELTLSEGLHVRCMAMCFTGILFLALT